MNRHRWLIAAALATTLVATGAHAGSRVDRSHAYTVDAPVVHVEPIVRSVRVSTPHEVCYDRDVERIVHERHHRSATPTIVGTIVGGVIGNQFGKGRGRTVATIAGAALGGSIGNDIGRKHHGRAHRVITTETHCDVEHVVEHEQRITGYHVTYLYDGREFRTRTATDPGDTIRVRVQMSPVQYNHRGKGRHSGY